MLQNDFSDISAASAAIDQVGIVKDATIVWQLSAQATVTGTSSGILVLQCSNDTAPLVDSNGKPLPTNWSPIPNTSTFITGAGVYLIPATEVCYRWVRASFTHNNGAVGTITVNLNSQGI